MKITTIHFIRHGKVENPEHVVYERLDGYGLSDLGRSQVCATAQYVAQNASMNDAMAVFSSPLQRTRETAGFILGELNEHRAAMGQAPLEIQTDERLLEIKNHFRGKNMTQQAILPQNWRYFMNLRHPSYGESYQSVAERMASFLDEKVEAFAGQTVIAVSHEGPIWALRCLLVNGAPQHWVWDRKAPLASITSISVDAVTHQVVSIRYADPAKNVRIEMSGDVK